MPAKKNTFTVQKEIIETYNVTDVVGEEETLVAEIMYVDGEFKRCKYNVKNNPYNREDWKVLSRLEDVLSEIDKGKHG